MQPNQHPKEHDGDGINSSTGSTPTQHNVYEAPSFSSDPLLSPPPAQQTGQPQQQQQNRPVPQPGQEDPGKVLGIVSVVLDVVGMALIGAILGYLSKKESQDAGFDGTLGNVGMIIGIVLTALSTLLIIAYFALIGILIGVGASSESSDSWTDDSETTQIRGEF